MNSKGHTLIELLLYIAVAGTMLTITTAFAQTLFEARIKAQVIAEVDAQGQRALTHILQTVRNAQGVTIPLAGASGSTLVLDVVSVSDDPTTFTVISEVLHITEGVGTPIALTNSRVAVSGFSIENISPAGAHDAVQVSLTVSAVNTSGRSEYNYEKTFTAGAVVRTP